MPVRLPKRTTFGLRPQAAWQTVPEEGILALPLTRVCTQQDVPLKPVSTPTLCWGLDKTLFSCLSFYLYKTGQVTAAAQMSHVPQLINDCKTANRGAGVVSSHSISYYLKSVNIPPGAWGPLGT